MIGKIHVFIINLPDREDRLKHIQKEFLNHDEFWPTIFEGYKHEIGAIGLWNGIRDILKNLVNDQEEMIILCEDDHQFTARYSKERLFNCIMAAKEKEADILAGGLSGFTSAISVDRQLYWVEKFSGLQFTIIFRKFFQRILNANFGIGDAADHKICSLTNNKFFIYPFVSIQKDFGYSDATPKNNSEGQVAKLFKQCDSKIKMLGRVSKFYDQGYRPNNGNYSNIGFGNITIPTYIINLPERNDRRIHIEEQFKEKPEFDVTIIEACKHKIGSLGLWFSIRKIIEMAIRNNDDVIVICEDNHEFTKLYSKEYLIQNIIEAHRQQVDLLSGGTTGFDAAIPITQNRFWINELYSTQFMIVYKKFFKNILTESFDDKAEPDKTLSEMTANKMIFHPFISVKNEFGYSDCTFINSKNGLVKQLFNESSKRLNQIYEVYVEFNEQKTSPKKT